MTSTTVAPVVACYPGASGAYDLCLDVGELSPVPADYVYPAPLGGDLQYSAPLRYLDLAAIDPSTPLAPNFVLEEIAQEYKGQWAVVQVHTIEHLQDMRDALGPLVINSGYRSPSYNASIGGASSSRHMYGDGVDIDPVDVTLDELADACTDNGAGYVELYVSHVHCDWRSDPLDDAFYTAAALVGSVLSAELPHRAATLSEQGGLWTAESEGFDEGEPLRQWTAYDAEGSIIETTHGDSYLPPEGTAEVEVVVGGRVTVRSRVP